MSSRSQNIMIAALGGEGGGVLADWIIAAADLADYPIQSTSIPGVAQRTGATTYYLELFPVKKAALGAARPILALTPTPGDIDVVIASELVEAARAIQNGFVTPDRTTLIASTNRVYAIGERMAMSDGRFDAERIGEAARQFSRCAVLFDAAAAAARTGVPINAVLFGALVASRALPFDRAGAEEAVRRMGKAVEANLRGLDIGLRESDAPVSAPMPAPQSMTARPLATSGDLDRFPLPVREWIGPAVERLIDYQGPWYARLFLDRLFRISDAESRRGDGDHAATAETARYLALWMSYEDVIRVADLKIRAERYQRIRLEVRAGAGEVVRVSEFLKPGLAEFCSILPPRAGRAVFEKLRASGFEDRLSRSMKIRSTDAAGFVLLRMLAGLRWWRPHTWRFRDEQERMEQWLDAIEEAAGRSGELALAIAQCGQIMKGYGETHARARRHFDLISRRYFRDQSTPPNSLAQAIAHAHRLALSDSSGAQLAAALAPAPAGSD